MLTTFKLNWELYVWVLRSCGDKQLNLSSSYVGVLPVWVILIALSYSFCCEAVFEGL